MPLRLRAAAFLTPFTTTSFQTFPRSSPRTCTSTSTTTTMSSPTPTVDAAKKFKIALCQMPVTADKAENIRTARDYLIRARAAGASLAILPECFNCPYDTSCFATYAEPLPSPPSPNTDAANPLPLPADTGSKTLDMLRATAIETGLTVVGGSIPERDGESGMLYNASVSVSPEGILLAKHRKAHLFDIDVPGRIKFTESSVLSAGDKATVFDANTLGVRIGVSICYDVRFPDFAAVQARQLGAQFLIFPGAFNLTTGPAHWELLLRARAVDNQVFVVGCSPARELEGEGYKAWGHSMVVDPWGEVVGGAKEGEELVVAEVDLGRVAEVRASIPTGVQRRGDIYELRMVGGD